MNELQPLYSRIDELIKLFSQNNEFGREKMNKVIQMVRKFSCGEFRDQHLVANSLETYDERTV